MFRSEGAKQVFDEGTVQIVTNFGLYSVFLPRDERLSEDIATTIAARLSKLEGQVTDHEAKLGVFKTAHDSNIRDNKQKFDAIARELLGKAQKGGFSLKVDGLQSCMAVLDHPIPGTGSWWPVVMAPCPGGYQKWSTD
jgi:hypothetical protein